MSIKSKKETGQHSQFASTFFVPPRNEDMIHNIILLSNELTSRETIPHAMIFFQKQLRDVLQFTIIVLRVLTPNCPTLHALSRKLPSDVHFIPKRVANVGDLEKKYIKEANVFSLEVENAPFMRNNRTIDLVLARKYVVEALTKMLGTFKDFNADSLF